MNPVLKNILAVISGVVVGSIVNMSLIEISGSIIPLPEGVDNSTMEGLAAGIQLFETKHFIFPFLAHGLGALVGAYIAALIAANNKMKFALAIGAFFLFGGISMVFMIPSPMAFNVIDLVLAYIPMAWIGGKLGTR